MLVMLLIKTNIQPVSLVKEGCFFYAFCFQKGIRISHDFLANHLPHKEIPTSVTFFCGEKLITNI